MGSDLGELARPPHGCRVTLKGADDGGGEGTTVGCTTAVESVAEGCATSEPLVFFLATFCASLVAAVGLRLTAGADVSFEAAASYLRVSLASLYFFLQSKHVKRGRIVPILICSHRNLSCPHV